MDQIFSVLGPGVEFISVAICEVLRVADGETQKALSGSESAAPRKRSPGFLKFIKGWATGGLPIIGEHNGG